MNSKKCSKCGQIKTIDMFHKRKRNIDGLNSSCKQCSKEYYLKNYTKIQLYKKKYDIENRDKRQLSSSYYRKNNKDKISQFAKKYYRNNQEKEKERGKQWRLQNKDRIREYRIKYKDICKNRHQERLAKDVNYRLRISLRKRLNIAIKDNQKTGSAVVDLGCSIEELKRHLESKFQEGMTWDNWSKSGWHIDHIIPLSSFDLTNREEFLIACNYTNLQPLWAKDNLIKSNS